METTTYTVNGMIFSVRHSSDQLQHYGVKGMKWGRRKALPPPTGGGRRGRQAGADSPEAQAAAKEARRQKAKRALKIGAAVAGTALAAYGTYKITQIAKDKAAQRRIQRGMEAAERMRQQYQRDSEMHNRIIADMMRGSAHGTYEMGGRKVTW